MNHLVQFSVALRPRWETIRSIRDGKSRTAASTFESLGTWALDHQFNWRAWLVPEWTDGRPLRHEADGTGAWTPWSLTRAVLLCWSDWLRCSGACAVYGFCGRKAASNYLRIDMRLRWLSVASTETIGLLGMGAQNRPGPPQLIIFSHGSWALGGKKKEKKEILYNSIFDSTKTFQYMTVH